MRPPGRRIWSLIHYLPVSPNSSSPSKAATSTEPQALLPMQFGFYKYLICQYNTRELINPDGLEMPGDINSYRYTVEGHLL